MELRPYQREAVNAVYRHLQERDDNPCVVLPPGCGKSLVISQIAADATKRWNGRVLILAHVKELLEQNADKLRRLCPDIDVGIYSAGLGRRDTNNKVLVAGIQSIYQRTEELGHFDLIIVDESHLIAPDGEGTYRTFLSAAKEINPDLRIIGLTATPYRMKGGLICQPDNILNHVCYEAGIREMIVQGYLSKLKSRNGQAKAELDNLHIRGGEFIASEIEQAMDRASLVHAACKEIVELTQNRHSVLLFTASVEHCKHVAAKIRQFSGMGCGIVTGDTPADERTEILARFRGETARDGLFDTKPPLKFLANVNVLTTGFDATAVDCVVLLRPTASVGLYVQMVGRGTRLHPDKEDCLILDYGGNVLRHGPVDAVTINDQDRNEGKAPAKECPECHALLHLAFRQCPECGHEFPEPEPQSKLKATASKASVLSGEVTVEDHEIRSVDYSVHAKRGADESHPKTMRVDYRVSLYRTVSEWICFEHSGWARQKAESWWRQRSDMPPPRTSAEAVELARSGALANTRQVTVRSASGDEYDRIIGYELGDKPDPEDALERLAIREEGLGTEGEWHEPVYAGIDPDEVPF